MTAPVVPIKMEIMKRIIFLIGIGLLAVAFLVSAAELAARTMLSGQGGGADLWMSTRTVWRTVAPYSYLALLNSSVWSDVKGLLNLPGWVLFGLPGLVLAMIFRHRDEDPVSAQTRQDHEDSLFLYDELAVAARKDGFHGTTDDRAPSHPDDVVAAEDHFANEIIEDALRPTRDYLLDEVKPRPPS